MFTIKDLSPLFLWYFIKRICIDSTMLAHLVVVMVKLILGPRIPCETQSVWISTTEIKSHLQIQLTINLPMLTTSQCKLGFLNLCKKLVAMCLMQYLWNALEFPLTTAPVYCYFNWLVSIKDNADSILSEYISTKMIEKKVPLIRSLTLDNHKGYWQYVLITILCYYNQ